MVTRQAENNCRELGNDDGDALYLLTAQINHVLDNVPQLKPTRIRTHVISYRRVLGFP